MALEPPSRLSDIHVEETLMAFSLDLEHSSMAKCEAAFRARKQPEPKLVLRDLVN